MKTKSNDASLNLPFEKRKQLFRQTNCKNQGRGYLEYMER